jgi:hypothetical protein
MTNVIIRRKSRHPPGVSHHRARPGAAQPQITGHPEDLRMIDRGYQTKSQDLNGCQ